MSRYFLRTAVAGLAFAVTAGQLPAQERAGADVEVRRISNILKTKVVIQEDKPAGEIVDVVYSDGGCIDYYVASYDNRQYVVPFAAVEYRPTDRVVFVDIAPTQFEHVHFFAANQWPDLYAPTFRDQVFTSFNVRVDARDRQTFRRGTDVDVDVRNRGRDRDRDPADRNRDRSNDRDDANRDRAPTTERDRDRPNADRRDGVRPDPSADRPEREPSRTPGTSGDRPRTEPSDDTPAPPRPGAGTNPGRDGAAPPRAGSDSNPGRGSVNPPRSEAKPPRSDSGASGEKKPLTPPPVVPK